MYIYQKEKRFDCRTGEEIDCELIPSHVICDYTGIFVGEVDRRDAPNSKVLYSVSFDYDNGSEPLWYEAYFDFEQKYNLGYGDFQNFMQSAYHFSHTAEYGAEDVSFVIFNEWIDNRKKGKGRWSDCGTFQHVLQDLRIKNLEKFLSEKLFTLEELGFIYMRDDC